MAKHVYEGMFILDSNKYAKDAAGTAGAIPSALEQFGGEVLASRLWEERRLAYPIKGHRKGTYWLTYFRLDATQLNNLTRQIQLSEGVVRHLLLKIDPRIADAMVQHALTGGGPIAERKKAESETAVEEVDVDIAVPETDEVEEA